MIRNNLHIGLLLLRIFLVFRLIYGVIDNVFSWSQMEEFASFLGAHQFPIPIVSAVLSVYLQFICGTMVLIGYQTKIAGFMLCLNFCVALIFVHFRVGDSIEGMTPALAMLFGAATLFFTGPGKYGIEKRTVPTDGS